MNNVKSLGLGDTIIFDSSSLMNLLESQYKLVIETVIPMQDLLIKIIDGIEPLKEQTL